ncbi:MAG: hypothetical protein ACE5IR_11940 [bacterium]
MLKIKNIVSALFLTESYYDIALLQTELLKLFEKEADKQAVSLLLNWFMQLSEFGRIEKADYHSLEKVYSSKAEVNAMLITAAAKVMLSKGMTVSLIFYPLEIKKTRRFRLYCFSIEDTV